MSHCGRHRTALVRQLLYKKWLADNRAAVEKLSGGKLGYLHIDAMSMPSFYKFEKELYDAGAGKDGLVIDVREMAAARPPIIYSRH